MKLDLIDMEIFHFLVREKHNNFGNRYEFINED